jgi:uncharacterized protein
MYDPRNEHYDMADFGLAPARQAAFPSTLVASTDDPTCTFERAVELAEAWGSELVNVGALGHINAASGLGDWPQGRALLKALLTRAGLA